MLRRARLAGARAPASFVGLAVATVSVTTAVALSATVRRVRADEPATPGLGAKARIRPDSRPEIISRDELEVLRGGLGDNFNPSEAFPGTVLLFSGVPYVLVRGAPPAGTSTYLNGVPVPSLFHLALGPAITHPSLVGQLEFHPAVAPARYGRHTGAVLSAEASRAPPERAHGEAELRLLDAQGLVVRPGDPDLGLHARLGYPGAMLSAIGSAAVLSYWDYHGRWQAHLDERDSVELEAFGAFDRVGDRNQPHDDIDLQFHRAVIRLRREVAGLQLGSSLYVGFERGRLGRELTAVSSRIGPSVFLELQQARGVHVRVGADMEAKLVHLRRDSSAGAAPNPQPGFGASAPSPDAVPNVEPNATEFIDRAPIARIPERNVVGAYAEFDFAIGNHVEIDAGLRGDMWLTAARAQQALDPRMRLRWRPFADLTLHAAVGTAHQAASSPLPIPGLDDFELDYGLQTALQSEAGVALDLPGEWSFSATGFHNDFAHLVFLELIVDCEGNTDPQARLLPYLPTARRLAVCAREGLPRGSGEAWGAEFLLKRSLRQRLNGWLSYTLAWASATASDGTDFTPQFDVRHLLNLVLTYRWGAGLESGMRLHFRSGKPAVNTIFDFAQGHLERVTTRLPAFLRVDLNFGYQWATSWGGLRITLQWLNLTFAREATKRDCSFDSALNLRCQIDYQPAIVLPNVGLAAVF